MFVSLSVAVIRFLSRRISRRQQHRWAPFVARCLARLVKGRVRTITRNISWCFPHDSLDQRRLLRQSVLTGTGLSVFDTLVAWFWTSAQIKRHIPHRIIGLNALLDVQNPVIEGCYYWQNIHNILSWMLGWLVCMRAWRGRRVTLCQCDDGKWASQCSRWLRTNPRSLSPG